MTDSPLPHRQATHRWLVLAIVAAAQFVFGVDAFIVNVALPTIASELHASSAQLEAVIAIYFIGYATLVVTGGRLGDIYGTKRVFLAGVLGFTAASLWCGFAQSAAELIAARLAQGALAALMVPQVLATIHVLFTDAARGKAFAIYGIVLGLAAAAGILLGSLLITFVPAGMGWRSIFFVNVPFGLAIIIAALCFMPSISKSVGARLDGGGAAILFVGLLCLIGPILFGRDLQWASWIWAIVALGVAIIAAFVAYERRLVSRDGKPLIDLALLSDNLFLRGLCAAFFFSFANLAFYLVMTVYLQSELHVPTLNAGLAYLPAALAFVVAAQHSGKRARSKGAFVLIEGCGIQLGGLAALALLVGYPGAVTEWMLALPIMIYGYGQGFVMAPLSSVVLSSVNASSAGAASGMYATVIQSANAIGVAAVGSLYFAVLAVTSGKVGLLAGFAMIAVSIAICSCFLFWRARSQQSSPA